MEVLETVDRERLAELHERDEFFWLDLTEPTAEDLKSVGEVLGLHPVALEDTIEFGQRPKLDQYGDHVLVVYYTARRAPESRMTPVEPVEIHIYISGSFVVTVRRSTCTELDELHHELDTADPKAEHYIVYRIFDVLTDAFYPIIEVARGAHRRDRGGGAARQAPAGAAGRDLPPQAERAGALPARRAPARPLPRRHGDDPQPAGPLARHARVPARRRRPPGADRRRAASSAGGPPGAHRDVLQRQREPAQQRRHAADDRRHVLPRLDARDRLLRPELRLAGRTTSTPSTTSCSTASARSSSPPWSSAPSSGSSARTGSEGISSALPPNQETLWRSIRSRWRSWRWNRASSRPRWPRG